jgi:hypothetical protein
MTEQMLFMAVGFVAGSGVVVLGMLFAMAFCGTAGNSDGPY